jgi:threonine/homoserine/homoserine lactone efflux protein
MNIVSLISLAIAIAVFAASPGPGIFAVVSRATASGFMPALGVVIGIIAGDVIYLLFAISGLSFIAETFENFFIAIKLVGGAYLLLLGWQIWTSNISETELQRTQQTKTGFKNITSGFLITLSNPKAILFYCGFLPGFINLRLLNITEIALIVLVVISVLSAALTIYAYCASYVRNILYEKNSFKKINRYAGGIMILSGVMIAVGVIKDII